MERKRRGCRRGQQSRVWVSSCALPGAAGRARGPGGGGVGGGVWWWGAKGASWAGCARMAARAGARGGAGPADVGRPCGGPIRAQLSTAHRHCRLGGGCGVGCARAVGLGGGCSAAELAQAWHLPPTHRCASADGTARPVAFHYQSLSFSPDGPAAAPQPQQLAGHSAEGSRPSRRKTATSQASTVILSRLTHTRWVHSAVLCAHGCGPPHPHRVFSRTADCRKPP